MKQRIPDFNTYINNHINESSSILRIRGISSQMNDYCDMMDVIDKNPKYLKAFSKIITKAIWEIINGGKVISHVMELKKEFFSDEKFIIETLQLRKSLIDTQFIKLKLDTYGLFFSKLLIKGAFGEIDDVATSMNKYILDDKLKEKLSNISVSRGKEKFFGMMPQEIK